jgi:dolichyl-phosphate beta-glucosyltransferase
MDKLPDFISVIIPGYNEEKRILPTLKAVSAFFKQNFERYEIIFVDDGSTDKTRSLVKDFITDHFMHVVRLSKNQGKGYAVKYGMLRARGQYRFFTDADLPYELSCFLSAIDVFNSHSCDMVIGDRDLPGSSGRSGLSWARRIGGRAFSAIANGLLKIDIKDTQCGFKGFTGDTAKEIFTRSTIRGYAFDVEIFILARELNLNIRNIPVNLMQRQYSKIHLARDSLIMLRDILRLYSRQIKLL